MRPLHLKLLLLFQWFALATLWGSLTDTDGNTPPISMEVVLFRSPGVPVADYSTQLKYVRPGDVLVFSNNQRFTVTEDLRGHHSSRVFVTKELGPKKVLKVALGKGNHPLVGIPYQQVLNQLLDGYQVLKLNKVQVLRVFPRLSVRDEYVIQERALPHRELNRPLTLDEFVDNYSDFPDNVRTEMEEALIAFARSIARFEKFGDQSGSQVLFTSKGWQIVDYLNNHKLATEPNSKRNPFVSSPSPSTSAVSIRSMGCAEFLIRIEFELGALQTTRATGASFLRVPAHLMERIEQAITAIRSEI